MNKLIKKIACAVMAFTLIAGVFTGCKANNSSAVPAELPSFTSVKDPSGDLPLKGTVGDMEYQILSQDQMGCYNKSRGYYIDQLEQLNSPMFIVITSGTQTAEGAEIRIVDFGMQDSTLVIVVEETKATGDKFTGLECPCVSLEVDHLSSDLLIVSTTGEVFEHITPA